MQKLKCSVYLGHAVVKGTVSGDFLLLVFFMNLFPPSPRVFRWDRFEFFRKFADIFASQGAPPVSTTPVANLPPVSATPVANFFTIFAGVVDTSGKFATGVNDTGGKFATGVNDTGGKICQQYQAAETLKWTWRQKFIYMLTLLPKDVQTKLLKFFSLKVFSICHRCRWHR